MSKIMRNNIEYAGIPFIYLTGTLTAGSTTITFQSGAITTNSLVEPFVDDAFCGVAPTASTTSAGSLTLTFPAQSSDMPVKVRIS